jgi:hypothetical protein
VYKGNPREQLYTPTDVAYHFDDEQVDEIYQEEELPTSFVIEHGAALDSLVGDGARCHRSSETKMITSEEKTY